MVGFDVECFPNHVVLEVLTCPGHSFLAPPQFEHTVVQHSLMIEICRQLGIVLLLVVFVG